MQIVSKKYATYKDEQLMIEVVKGDEHAFSQIYDRWSKPILNYFFKMLWQDSEKAQDMMQDLFVKIINKPHQYDPKRSFKTWIYTVAYNMCKNEYRKHETRKVVSNNLDENIGVKDSSYNYENKTDKGFFNQRLKEELELMSDNHRKVFIMRMKHDLSIKEIAEIMKTSEGTVKSRIFYALKKLSENLKEFKPSNISPLFVLLMNLFLKEL